MKNILIIIFILVVSISFSGCGIANNMNKSLILKETGNMGINNNAIPREILHVYNSSCEW